MATIKKIKSDIESVINRDFQFWFLGISDKPQNVRSDKNSPVYWHQWEVESIKDAKNIEEYFLQKGCLSCSLTLSESEISKENKVYVYFY